MFLPNLKYIRHQILASFQTLTFSFMCLPDLLQVSFHFTLSLTEVSITTIQFNVSCLIVYQTFLKVVFIYSKLEGMYNLAWP